MIQILCDRLIQQDTGVLYVLSDPGQERLIYFKKGRPVYIESNISSETFGPFLLREHLIEPVQLNEALNVLKDHHTMKLGHILIQKGILDAGTTFSKLSLHQREKLNHVLELPHPFETTFAVLDAFPPELTVFEVGFEEVLLDALKQDPGHIKWWRERFEEKYAYTDQDLVCLNGDLSTHLRYTTSLLRTCNTLKYPNTLDRHAKQLDQSVDALKATLGFLLSFPGMQCERQEPSIQSGDASKDQAQRVKESKAKIATEGREESNPVNVERETVETAASFSNPGSDQSKGLTTNANEDNPDYMAKRRAQRLETLHAGNQSAKAMWQKSLKQGFYEMLEIRNPEPSVPMIRGQVAKVERKIMQLNDKDVQRKMFERLDLGRRVLENRDVKALYVRRGKKINTDPSRAEDEQRFLMAALEMSSQKFDKAYGHLDKLCQSNDLDPLYRAYRAYAGGMAGQIPVETAKNELMDTFLVDQSEPQVYVFAAKLFEKLGQLNEAIDVLRKCLKVYPTYRAASEAIANCQKLKSRSFAAQAI